MQKIIVLILGMTLLSNFAWAAECKSVAWPFSTEIASIKPVVFDSFKRDHLYKYLYHEISSQPDKRIKGLAEKLFFYLKNTEQNEDRYNMVQALEWAAGLQDPKPNVIPMNEICAMEEKISRTPSSSKKTKAKVSKTKK